MNFFRRLSSLCAVCFFAVITLFTANGVKAAATPYKVVYNAEYTPINETDLAVKLLISLQNLRSDVYIQEFSINLPPHFAISNPQTKIENEAVQTQIKSEKNSTQIMFTLPESSARKDNQTNLELTYTQKNGIKHVGSIWEVILPTISNKDDSTFSALFHVPPGVDRHVGVIKPPPTEVLGESIRWDNVKTPVIYVAFGTSQRYQTNLTYTIKNPDLLTKKTSIALPPQTSYQKVYENFIDPQPARTYIDSDGNYLAEYALAPRQEMTIHYSGIVEVFARPNNTMKSFNETAFEDQKKYIFNNISYWNVPKTYEFPEKINTVKDVFDRVVNHLSYDREQIKASGSRKGAQFALNNPTQAVCTEYTDLFVALARNANIPAREIEGFAYSDDATLRPQSFSGDILHSWPEYYDEAQNVWIPTDPTWADTSSIDYFNSFDLNHIVLAIHGKDPVYPLPAGMYKVRDQKDIDIKPIAILPKEVKNVTATFDMQETVAPLSTSHGSVIIENNSNVFLVDPSFRIKSSSLTFKPNVLSAKLIAPHEKREIPFSYTVSKNASENNKAQISLLLDDKEIASKNLSVRSSFESILNYLIGIGFALLILTIIFFRYIKKRIS